MKNGEILNRCQGKQKTYRGPDLKQNGSAADIRQACLWGDGKPMTNTENV